MARQVDPRVIAERLAKDAPDQPGIAAFLTNGSYSAMSPNERQFVERVLRGTQFEGAPGQFFIALRETEQANAGETQARTREIRENAPAVPPPPSAGVVRGGVQDERAGVTEASGARGRAGADAPNIAAAIEAAGNANAANAQRSAEQQTGSTSGAGGVPTGGRGRAISDFQFDPKDGVSNDVFLDEMFRQAGLNPDVLTAGSKAAMRGMTPIFQALRQAYGQANNKVGGGISDFLTGFAKQVSDGSDFFGNVRQYARGIPGSEDFNTAIGSLRDQDSVVQSYRNLLPLLYAGANPLYGQAASDVVSKAQRGYDNSTLGNPNGLFGDWLDEQGASMTPFMRSIFGR